MDRGAVFSPCGMYRYTLERRWADGPMLLWVLLNPSIADAQRDDPTNRRGIAFSRQWGFGACVFVNLFAFRSPSPSEMKAAWQPIGPENDSHILDQVEKADRIVVAWGIHGPHRNRDRDVLALLSEQKLFCLGITQKGHPRHPLYMRGDTIHQKFRDGADREE